MIFLKLKIQMRNFKLSAGNLFVFISTIIFIWQNSCTIYIIRSWPQIQKYLYSKIHANHYHFWQFDKLNLMLVYKIFNLILDTETLPTPFIFNSWDSLFLSSVGGSNPLVPYPYRILFCRALLTFTWPKKTLKIRFLFQNSWGKSHGGSVIPNVSTRSTAPF